MAYHGNLDVNCPHKVMPAIVYMSSGGKRGKGARVAMAGLRISGFSGTK